MGLRVRLIGIETPHILIRTIHRNTLLNAHGLKHILPAEYRNELFPPGTGINFDFEELDRIHLVHLHLEKADCVHLNGKPMVFGEKYAMKLHEEGIISVRGTLLNVGIIESHF